MELNCKVIEFGSAVQLESIELRRKVLREPLGLNFTESELEDEQDQIHIACFADGRMVGILLFKKLNAIVLKMRQVAVIQEMQGQGVGTALVNFAEQWALENEWCLVTLHARDTAVPFYLQLGYILQSDMFHEVGIPHYIMRKELELI